MTTTKAPRNTKLLTPGEAGSRIERIAIGLPERIKAREAHYYGRAEREARDLAQKEIGRLLLRVEESQRSRVVDVVKALGFELCGLEIVIGNDALVDPEEPEADEAGQGSDDFPVDAPEEMPAGARPLEPARQERIGRMTGAKR